MSDYIELGPDDVIREGDECQSVSYEGDVWARCVSSFGVPVRAFSYKYRFRRLRHVAIRGAAIELLRDAYDAPSTTDVTGMLPSNKLIHWVLLMDAKIEALREAIGISVEELREDDK